MNDFAVSPETERMLNRVEEQRKQLRVAQSLEAEIKRRISPVGVLGLPPLLDERRALYGITDAVFDQLCMFNKIHLIQIPRDQSECYEGTSIVMPDQGKDRTRYEVNRGIIVSAGLQALDVLETNGSGLGHIVQFMRLSPWRSVFEVIMGHERYLMPLAVSDIIADEDAAANLREGKLKRSRTPSGRHSYDGNEPLVPALEDMAT